MFFSLICYNLSGDIMNELEKFYSSILNIRNNDNRNLIVNVVKDEKQKLLNEVGCLDGFCKYMASQIEEKLRNANITTYLIDLSSLVSVDHVFLIAEYKSENNLKRLLIDPTFSQFVNDGNKQLVSLKKWPGDNLDNNIVNDLLKDGVVDIDEDRFNEYLNSFSDDNIHVDLNQYLLNKKLDNINVRKK